MLPVSVIALLCDDEVAADDEEDEDEGEEPPELPQAAASTVSGIRAAAVHIMRIRLATGTYSFCFFTRPRQGARYPARTRVRAMI